jgi:hypothetical protein
MPSGYDLQQHVVSVRLRIQGTGTFYSNLSGLEGSPTQDLVDITLQAAPSRPVSLLSNIQSTRIQFYGRMTAIDEHFRLKNLTFYARPVASGYPQ